MSSFQFNIKGTISRALVRKIDELGFGQMSSFGTEKVAMQAEKNALSAERKQLEQKLKNTETELIMVKNLKAQAELRYSLAHPSESRSCSGLDPLTFFHTNKVEYKYLYEFNL